MRYETKNILASFTVAVFFTIGVHAQQQPQPQVYELTAKEAVDLAFKNVAGIKNAKLDYQISEARNKEITGMALPQVSGTLQGNHYLSLPVIQFPDATESFIYQVLKDNNVQNGATGMTINKTVDPTVRNVSFLTPWNVNAGIAVNQLLFEPQVFVGLQARKELLVNSGLQIKVIEDSVRVSVYKSYYAVLTSQKQLVFLKETIKRLEKLASDQNEMFKNGFVERLDIDKTTVNLNNTRTIETQLNTALAIGIAILKMNLWLSQADSIVLKDSLTPDYIKENILEDTFRYEDRNEIKLLNSVVKLQSYDVKRYRMSYYPTVSAFYNFQKNGQRRNDEGGNSAPWFWYNINLIGLNVNVPIFDGFQKKYKIKQAEFAMDKTKNTLDMAIKGIDMEKNIAKTALTNAIVTMDRQESNMQLAERVYNSVKKKYEQGLGSSMEVLQSDREFQQAQADYFRSLYEAIVAKISYQKALGKL